MVSGYFNPLHVGHLDMMEAARALGDALVVIVNNDAQQVLKKGKVITTQTDRLRIVDALRVADSALVAVDEDGSVAASLEVIHAAYPGVDLVFCNGGDRSPDGDAVPGAEVAVCERLGIEMAWGVGGQTKADSSSRINEALGH
ncbi:adenylyltransferase/cytidyltransferase family protein [Nocardioides agariphilus]|uniref:Adenylyltransferase/cytidyltransferase family protein n=1 Tax=Nocardioides agariphilus TaxID=433664 RepID=A0A930VKR8_9ACTN|nr:adenylyltransferase/cytidyltransferase family protein [Nocardioides agariphilus]